MGFFRTLFNNDIVPPTIPVNATPVPSVPPRSIGYDPKLIDSMLRDHAELGRLFARIGDAQNAGEFQDVRALLVNFKSRLEAHVLTENVRFYNYLEQTLSDDPNNTGMMHDFRREMNTIARSVIKFVKTYQSSKFTPEESRQFVKDYKTVEKILEQRLDSEENNLYPLYQPS